MLNFCMKSFQEKQDYSYQSQTRPENSDYILISMK